MSLLDSHFYMFHYQRKQLPPFQYLVQANHKHKILWTTVFLHRKTYDIFQNKIEDQQPRKACDTIWVTLNDFEMGKQQKK